MPVPHLGERWNMPHVDEEWPKAQRILAPGLRALQRLLGTLHPAIEHRNIEQLPDKVLCTADTALTTTGITDITGAAVTIEEDGTISLDVDLHVLVLGTLAADCTAFGAATHRLTGYLYVNGTEVATGERMVTSAAAVNDRRHLMQSWIVSLTSGQSYEFKLRADISNAGTQWNVRATDTGLAFLLMPNRFTPGQPTG